MQDDELKALRVRYAVEVESVSGESWDFCGKGILVGKEIIEELDRRIAKLTKPIHDTALRVPLPPSVNHYWENNGRGGKILSEAGASFRSAAGWMAIQQGYDNRLDSNLFVNIHHYQHGGDSDNRVKPLFDALNKVVWEDDKQITRHCVEIHLIGKDEEQYTLLDVFER